MLLLGSNHWDQQYMTIENKRPPHIKFVAKKDPRGKTTKGMVQN
jgi:hypothetical protein